MYPYLFFFSKTIFFRLKIIQIFLSDFMFSTIIVFIYFYNNSIKPNSIIYENN